MGFRVAGDTEPGQLRQTEKFANGKWGSELQGTQNQEKTGRKRLRMESGVTGCGRHGRGWVRGEGGG